jgi:hypothetical protein
MSLNAQTPTMAGRTDRVNRPFDDPDRRGEPLYNNEALSDGVPSVDTADTRPVPRAPGSVSPQRAP